MTICIIAAVADNGIIGRDGELPWHLPTDLKRFKRLTSGHVVIMGRRTFESIGRPLPDRRCIVLTRDPEFYADGISAARSLQQALLMAEEAPIVFIIGGAEVYRDGLPLTDRLYLTRVHATIEGDVSFPPLDELTWELERQDHHGMDDEHPYAFTNLEYRRRDPKPPG